MKILIVTPLYPPDIKEPAPYVKELADRLSLTHAVTVLAFNHIPERVTGVEIVSVEKSDVLPIRLFRFLRALARTSRDVDIVYVQNGPSVELPVLLFSFFNPKPLYVRLGDEVALEHSEATPLLRALLHALVRRATGIVVHPESSMVSAFFMKHVPQARIHAMKRPLMRPEILPFVPHPDEAFGAYEASWTEHTEKLNTLFVQGN